MSVKIRLRRMGARKRPFYRLVVTDSRSPRDGKFLEILGTFDPLTEPVTLRLDIEKTRSWLQKGARPSDTARKFLIDNGLLPKESARKRPSKPPKSAAPSAPAAPTPPAVPATPAAPVVEEAKA